MGLRGDLNEGVACVYCGAEAAHREHVIPVSLTHRQRNYRDKENLAPACPECNAGLGAKLFEGVKEKAKYLLGWYQKRYAKLLKAPVWEERELEELGPVLRASLEVEGLKREAVLDKIKHLIAVTE